MWGFEQQAEERKTLQCTTFDEFKRRLKTSFGSGEFLETAPTETASSCLVCTAELTEGYGKIVRKCLVSDFPCSGSMCVCPVPQICHACFVETLWKSPRSQKSLGRFRASCPACRADYCHYDVGSVRREAPEILRVKKAPVRHVLLRRAADTKLEEERLHNYVASQSDNLMGRIWVFAFEAGSKNDSASLVLTKLSNEERKAVHSLAESLGLTHESSGDKDARVLTIGRSVDQRSAISDVLICEGYVALQGASVEAAAFLAKSEDRISIESRTARRARDGDQHHITLVTRKELQMWAKRQGLAKVSRDFTNNVMSSISEEVVNDWTVIGIGHAVNDVGDEEAFFVVLDWASANAWREKNELPPQDYHITVGFVGADVHNKSKGRDALF